MRTIDALAVSLGLIACLALGRSGVQPTPAEIAAETWMLEQDMAGLLHTMSSPAEACYAMALPSGADGVPTLAQSDAGAMLAANCDPSTIAQFG